MKTIVKKALDRLYNIDWVPKNCLTFALDKLLTEGGYITFRKSSHWGIMHALHVSVKDGIQNYVPPDKLDHPLLAFIGFKASVINSDDASVAKPMQIGWIILSSYILAIGATAWGLNRWFKKLINKFRR